TLVARENFLDRADVLPSFWKSRLTDIGFAVSRVRKGHVRTLARTAGGRNLQLVTYGQKNTLPTTANYNSACGGNDPASYRHKDGKQKAVVFLLGPVHGGEFEGIVRLNNLLSLAETGQVLAGRPWPHLAANLRRLR